MEKLNTHTGSVVALDLAHMDTDQIIPKQFLKFIERSGFGRYLFYNHRFREETGEPYHDFVLNQPHSDGATILLARENFGCGSSREHAVWALLDYGFRVLIAPSFADIFRENCFNNGVLPVELAPDVVDEWFRRAGSNGGYSIVVDVEAQTLTGSDGFSCSFELHPHDKRRLLEGLDEIGVTLKHGEAISRYEQNRNEPWQAAHSGPVGKVEECG